MHVKQEVTDETQDIRHDRVEVKLQDVQGNSAVQRIHVGFY